MRKLVSHLVLSVPMLWPSDVGGLRQALFNKGTSLTHVSGLDPWNNGGQGRS